MNTQTSNTADIVVVNQKSALVGFLLALIGLGWFGIDRFYKGDTKIGLFKLFCPFLVLVALFGFQSTNAAIVILGIGCFFWLLDWILVPLGISRDNAKKLAIAQGIEPKEDDPYEYSAPKEPLIKLSEGTTKVIAVVACIVLLVGILSIYFYLWQYS